ncbi:hypothetical protein [Streptomyces sp. NPDC056948]|uniref:hypothetical protein n=1 Tax=Streptomyces sp. NPDC056948 TaxID=3345975 RepID=UPI00363E4FF7
MAGHDRFQNALAALVARAVPRHGAALAAYGPHAEEHTAELTRLFAHKLGYAPATLTAYQAAYALTTYDLFGLDDSDGHFWWCVEQLCRNAVFSRQLRHAP